jgi:hypothetical protein
MTEDRESIASCVHHITPHALNGSQMNIEYRTETNGRNGNVYQTSAEQTISSMLSLLFLGKRVRTCLKTAKFYFTFVLCITAHMIME